MEPRSLDRGNPPGGSGIVSHFETLQWSRGLSTAETELAEVVLAERERASMEPRSLDRGNHDTSPKAQQIAKAASMEPRSLDRGNKRRSAQAWACPTRFNGAAVSRPRKRRRCCDSAEN